MLSYLGLVAQKKSQTVRYYIEPQIIQMKSKISRHFASTEYALLCQYKL